jgi:hypothetical protein
MVRGTAENLMCGLFVVERIFLCFSLPKKC